jgi:hypothetical protein
MGAAEQLRPMSVLLHVEAKERGFRNPRSFRRWCKSHSVPICRDGRREWVRPADVQVAIDAINAPSPASPANDPVASIVGRLMRAN